MAFIPLSQQQRLLGGQRQVTSAAPTGAMGGPTTFRTQQKELYRDPYEQGYLPPPDGIWDEFNNPEPPPKLSYDIVGKPEPDVYDPPPTMPNLPETPGLTQDPGSLKLPDFNSPIDLSWLESVIGKVGGTVADYFKNPAAFPAIATAYQQWKNAEKYGDLAEGYKKEGNPYGPYRERAAQRLEELYADPSSIENTPGYKFRLSQGMGKKSGQLGAQQAGWGNEFADMQNYAQGLASTEYGNEVERLMKQAGVGIGPEASLSAQTNAYNQQVAAQNGALQALATPFGQNQGDARTGGGSGIDLGAIPTGGFSAKDIVNGVIKLANGSSIDYNQLVQAAARGDPTAIATYQKLFLQTPPGTPPDQGGEWGGQNPIGPPEQFGPPEPNYPDPGDGSYGPPIEVPLPEVDYTGDGFDSFFG